MWHSTEKCVLGYTLQRNLIAALQAESSAIDALTGEKAMYFLNICSQFIMSSFLFHIFVHETPNVGQE